MNVDERYKITSYSIKEPSNGIAWVCEHIIDMEEPDCDGIYRIAMSLKDIMLVLACATRTTRISYMVGGLKINPCVGIIVPYQKINTMMASGLTYGITGKCDLIKVGMTDDGLRFTHHDSKKEITIQNTSNRTFKKVVLECAKITKKSSARERIDLQSAELEFVSKGGEITKNRTDF